MFYACGYTKLTKLDLGDKFDTTNVNSMGNMFRLCGYSSMASLDLGIFGNNISKLIFCNTLFTDCGNTGCVITVKSQAVKDWIINTCHYTKGTVSVAG